MNKVSAELLLDVQCQDPRWQALDLEARLPSIATTLAQDCWPHSPHAQRYAKILAGQKLALQATVVLADDSLVRQLNRDYRGFDKTTNVLSFASLDDDDAAQSLAFELPDLALGDIILSYDCLEQEAKAQNITLLAHAEHLIIHGLLHLQGYLHDTDEQAAQMEGHESRMMRARGWSDPYS